MAFLSHWYKHQEAGKTWPLKFLKPQRQVFQEDEDPADGRDGGGEGFTAEDDDHDEGDGDEEHLKSQTHCAAKGKGVAKHCYESGKIEYNLLKRISDLVYYFTLEKYKLVYSLNII